MIVGLPKEIKDNEYRVGLTPAGVRALTDAGHKVNVERAAGEGSGFEDALYERAGATIIESADDVWAGADMIVKVKEPIAPEYPRMKEGLLLFTYLHLAPDREQTKQLLERKVTGIAYETITDRRGTLPLLTPMSEVAGRMAVQVGATYLERMNGGRGVLLGGVPGVPAARVVIIGGGVVGTNAAKIAVGMGAHVTIIDRDLDRLRELDDIFLSKISTLASFGLRHPRRDLRGRPHHRRGARPRRGGAAARHARDAEGRAERRGHRGRGGRSGRLHRDDAPDDALEPDLLRGGRAALLRRQHARRRAAHLDLRADERDAALRAEARQPRAARGGRRATPASRRASTRTPGTSPTRRSPSIRGWSTRPLTKRSAQGLRGRARRRAAQ